VGPKGGQPSRDAEAQPGESNLGPRRGAAGARHGMVAHPDLASLAQPEGRLDGPAGLQGLSGLDSNMSAQQAIFRPGRLYSGPAAVCLLFKYTCTYNSTCIVYISHNKGVLWYTRGYIPDRCHVSQSTAPRSNQNSNRNSNSRFLLQLVKSI
jgi:hypothetical protein